MYDLGVQGPHPVVHDLDDQGCSFTAMRLVKDSECAGRCVVVDIIDDSRIVDRARLIAASVDF